MISVGIHVVSRKGRGKGGEEVVQNHFEEGHAVRGKTKKGGIKGENKKQKKCNVLNG
jgi:hypothetical protein